MPQRPIRPLMGTTQYDTGPFFGRGPKADSGHSTLVLALRGGQSLCRIAVSCVLWWALLAGNHMPMVSLEGSGAGGIRSARAQGAEQPRGCCRFLLFRQERLLAVADLDFGRCGIRELGGHWAVAASQPTGSVWRAQVQVGMWVPSSREQGPNTHVCVCLCWCFYVSTSKNIPKQHKQSTNEWVYSVQYVVSRAGRGEWAVATPLSARWGGGGGGDGR